jgi:galactokinase
MVNIDELKTRFADEFDGALPTVLARAPGRVNLIGEHTDYNEGFAMPAATARYLWVAARRRDDRLLRVCSTAFNQRARFDPAGEQAGRAPTWMSYVSGLASSLRNRGFDPPGADLLIHSELRPGGGTGSSAALTVACAKALTALGGGLFETSELVDMCVAAERDYAGTPCGVLDPCACLLSRQGTSMLLDCRSLKVDYLPASPPGARFVLVDSGVTHQNRSGKYAERRAECQEGVNYFQRINPQIRSLRDVDRDLLARHMQQMDPTVASRCHHVVSENRRVLEAAAALRKADPDLLGNLMLASHRSLRDQFRVSCPELDRLVEIICGACGVFGARMMGGGFGGNVIALCREEVVDNLCEVVRTEYKVADAGELLTVETCSGADWKAL